MTNSVEFIRNMRQHHLEASRRYAGKNIAWSADGTQVLAAAEELADLYAEMARQGVTDFVVDFSPTMVEAPGTNGQPGSTAPGTTNP